MPTIKGMSKKVESVATLALELSNEFQRNVTTYYDSLWRRLKSLLSGEASKAVHTRLVEAANRDVSVLKEARARLAGSSDSRARGALRLLDSAIQSVE